MGADQSMETERSKLLHSELTEKIMGVYYDVYNEIGHGFLESVYGNCMQRALTEAGFSAQREVSIPFYFRELKAAQNLDHSHEAPVMNYLRATELEVGLLFNFGGPKPQFRRIVFENPNKKIRVHPRSSAVGGSAKT
jgi:PD-(D/E)XK nuclease superfamily